MHFKNGLPHVCIALFWSFCIPGGSLKPSVWENFSKPCDASFLCTIYFHSPQQTTLAWVSELDDATIFFHAIPHPSPPSWGRRETGLRCNCNGGQRCMWFGVIVVVAGFTVYQGKRVYNNVFLCQAKLKITKSPLSTSGNEEQWLNSLAFTIWNTVDGCFRAGRNMTCR